LSKDALVQLVAEKKYFHEGFEPDRKKSLRPASLQRAFFRRLT
jgi:hypothetical protein